MLTRLLQRRGALFAVVGVYAAVLLFAYAQMVRFVPDTITFGILDAARHLADGHGFRSHAIPTAFLPYYRDHTLPLPYMWYPLLPFVTGVWFMVFGPEPRLLLIVPVASYFLSGFLMAELGRRLFSPMVGVLAALVLLSQPFMLETSVRENFTDPILVALTLGCVLSILAAGNEETRSRRSDMLLICAGCLLGLCQYARSAAVAMYIPVAVLTYAVMRVGRWRSIALLVGTALLAQFPLFAYNLKSVGSLSFTPTYILLFLSEAFPGLASFTVLLPTSMSEVFGQYPGVITRKRLSQIWVHYKYFFTFMNPLLLASALLLPLTRLTAPQQAVVLFTGVFLAVLVPFNSLIYWDNRYLLPVVPLMVLLGVASLHAMLSAAGHRHVRAIVAACCVLLVAIEPIDFFYQVWKTRSQYPLILTTLEDQATFLRSVIRSGDVVMAPDPGLIGWEVNVPAVTQARTPEIALEVRERYFPFNVLVLEASQPRLDMFGRSPEWYAIAAGTTTFGNFRIVARHTSGHQTLVILRDGV